MAFNRQGRLKARRCASAPKRRASGRSTSQDSHSAITSTLTVPEVLLLDLSSIKQVADTVTLLPLRPAIALETSMFSGGGRCCRKKR